MKLSVKKVDSNRIEAFLIFFFFFKDENSRNEADHVWKKYSIKRTRKEMKSLRLYYGTVCGIMHALERKACKYD